MLKIYLFYILYIGKLNFTLDYPNKNNDKIFFESQVHKTLHQYVTLFDFILEKNIFSVKCNKKENELWTHLSKIHTFAIHDGVSLIKISDIQNAFCGQSASVF